MLVPINWMKEYVDIDADAKLIADEVTLSGSHVDSIEYTDRGINGVVIGKIKEIKKHPNADKLVITEIDLGDRQATIVTGAKNVYEGAIVPVALSGATLANGDKIGDHDFRGIMSEGMLCSYQELGYTDSVIPKEYRDGILIFKDDIKLGTSVIDALDMNDGVIEFEITPNRPDCLSIIGMARETAATFDTQINLPDIKSEFNDRTIEDFEAVEIKTDKCDKIILRVLEDVKIGESPNWLQNKIMKAGMRPTNNIVDLTNYVMLEFGQPLHAYDLDKITGNKLYVRQAVDGELITCIDSQERKLEPSDIVIADDSGAVGIAGVMGGLDTEVTSTTKRILLESACFNKESIRNTSKRLGLRSEASIRSEKGIPLGQVDTAASRFCTLVDELGIATVLNTDFVDNPVVHEPINVVMRYDKVNSLLGTKLTKTEMLHYLERLDFEYKDNGESCMVTVPEFRTDIEIEADLIEEIGRLYGFHNIEPQPLCGELIKGGINKNRLVEDILKTNLYALNYFEALSYSFISPRSNERAGINDINSKRGVMILNPLGEEFSLMRTSIIPNMLEILSKNQKQKADKLSIYELGNIFVDEEGELPSQLRRLCIGSYNTDFYKLKAEIKQLLKKIGIENLRFVKNTGVETFHPGRCADILLNDKCIGIIGEVSYGVSEEYDLKKRSYIADIDVESLVEFAKLEQTYKKIVRFPSITRDIALVVDKDLQAEDIELVINSIDASIIEKINLFDVFTGEQIGEGKKSMAYQIVYRAVDRTLVDDEVNAIQEELIEKLKTTFGATLRN